MRRQAARIESVLVLLCDDTGRILLLPSRPLVLTTHANAVHLSAPRPKELQELGLGCQAVKKLATKAREPAFKLSAFLMATILCIPPIVNCCALRAA